MKEGRADISEAPLVKKEFGVHVDQRAHRIIIQPVFPIGKGETITLGGVCTLYETIQRRKVEGLGKGGV